MLLVTSRDALVTPNSWIFAARLDSHAAPEVLGLRETSGQAMARRGWETNISTGRVFEGVEHTRIFSKCLKDFLQKRMV